MSEVFRKTVELGGRSVTFETGRVAKQASGSVWLTAGGTTILVTAQGASEARAGINFLPLTVDYQEKMSAGGKIPGGFFKREGRPREDETLTSRIIDRSIRPLFTEGWGVETQVIATVLSADPENPPAELALTGASLALELSDLPFQGPICGLRVCRIDGELTINPSLERVDEADINLMVACSRDAIVMVEGGALEASEKDIIDALLLAHEAAQPVLDLQTALRQEAGKPKRAPEPKETDADLRDKVDAVARDKVAQAYTIREKLARYAALDQAKKEVKEALVQQDESLAERGDEISEFLSELKQRYVRQRIISEKIRIDGRGLTDIRPITVEVGVLARTHGSALFTRGETQAIVTTTLGTRQDEQRLDDLFGDKFRNFMLHYNFPPYSVGEVKFLRSPGRREIGHGALANRALENLVDFDDESFPYTVRIVSDITESNGSSSMATVCGGSLAMMDAGVPLKGACAGIAMGLIKEGDDIAILSDILGDEDHLGDMDFKVAGTAKGVTAIQMDIKITGVTREILEQALEQARQGRLHIIGEMARVIDTSREEMSDYAPRITSLKIKVDRIRDVIGPGGKVIKDIVARTGCQIDIQDDGRVTIASTDGESAKNAIKMIEDLTQEAEVGRVYMGNVRKITDFGAFVEIFPGTDGLIHISELAHKRVKRVEDVLQEGDEVMVKVIGVERGKIRLSRKEALADEERRQKQDEPELSEAHAE